MENVLKDLHAALLEKYKTAYNPIAAAQYALSDFVAMYRTCGAEAVEYLKQDLEDVIACNQKRAGV